jgi:Ca-activated chloride channel family protein
MAENGEGLMKTLVRILAAAWTLALMAAPAQSADRAIIVLDGSGSMWAQIDGTARITIARETLDQVLGTLPPELELGFITYGHRERGNCADIELLVPPGPGTASAISAAAADINPVGMTPLSDAVRLAAEELRYTEEKATVILITDGLETCEADPCALGNELEASGIDFTAHVVGFGLTDEEGRQVACLAENTGGQYLQANDAAALGDALATTVAEVAEAPPAPDPEPAPTPPPAAPEFNLVPTASLSEGGAVLGPSDPIAGGIAWALHRRDAAGGRGDYIDTNYGSEWRADLDPGDYMLVATLGLAEVEQPVTITADGVAEPFFVMNAGVLDIRAVHVAGGETADGAAIRLEAGDIATTGYGAMTTVMPAGEVTIRTELGNGGTTETVSLAAGETIEREIVLGVGRAMVNAYYSEGGEKVGGGIAQTIYEARRSLDGSRESVTTSYGPDMSFDLAPGDYIYAASIDAVSAEVPFTVTAGELVEVTVVLDAGVLAASSPGASSLQVVAARADLQGQRASLALAYGETLQTTVPAGDYVVIAERPDGARSELPVTVRVGERSEITVEPAAPSGGKGG